MTPQHRIRITTTAEGWRRHTYRHRVHLLWEPPDQQRDARGVWQPVPDGWAYSGGRHFDTAPFALVATTAPAMPPQRTTAPVAPREPLAVRVPTVPRPAPLWWDALGVALIVTVLAGCVAVLALCGWAGLWAVRAVMGAAWRIAGGN